jgi:hypothetical protein
MPSSRWLYAKFSSTLHASRARSSPHALGTAIEAAPSSAQGSAASRSDRRGSGHAARIIDLPRLTHLRHRLCVAAPRDDDNISGGAILSRGNI